MKLGTCSDGRVLSYDARLCEFRIGKEAVSYCFVGAMDEEGLVTWKHAQHRDWFHQLGPEGAAACRRHAMEDADALENALRKSGLVSQVEGAIQRARQALADEELAWN